MMSHLDLAIKEFRSGNYPGAETLCAAALAQNPRSVPALRLQVTISVNTGKYLQARVLLNKLIVNSPIGALDNDVYMTLGYVCSALQDTAGAIGAYQQVLASEPRNIVATGYLCLLHYNAGQIERARSFVDNFLAALPELSVDIARRESRLMGKCIFLAAQLVRDEKVQQSLKYVASFVEDDRFKTLSTDTNFLFGSALLSEKSGDCSKALDFYRRGNEGKRRGSPYDIDQALARIESLRALYGREYFQSGSSLAPSVPGPIPVFVVGMPRSGTSLVEQVLASHTRVSALGEVNYLSRALVEVCSPCDKASPVQSGPIVLDESALLAIRRRYLQWANVPAGSGFFTDKMPDNLLHLWLVAKVFPEAKVICLRRDKLANVMSCFTMNFKHAQQFSESLDECARYYDANLLLAEHWRACMPGQVRILAYEQLVADPDREIAELLDWVGLPREQACFAPHRLSRAVGTASQIQVTRPIDSQGNRRWEPYRALVAQELGMFAE